MPFLKIISKFRMLYLFPEQGALKPLWHLCHLGTGDPSSGEGTPASGPQPAGQSQGAAQGPHAPLPGAPLSSAGGTGEGSQRAVQLTGLALCPDWWSPRGDMRKPNVARSPQFSTEVRGPDVNGSGPVYKHRQLFQIFYTTVSTGPNTIINGHWSSGSGRQAQTVLTLEKMAKGKVMGFSRKGRPRKWEEEELAFTLEGLKKAVRMWELPPYFITEPSMKRGLEMVGQHNESGG